MIDSDFKAPRPIPVAPLGWNPPSKEKQTAIPKNFKVRNMAEKGAEAYLAEIKKAFRAARKESKKEMQGNVNILASVPLKVSKEETKAKKLLEKEAAKLLKPEKLEKPFKATVQFQDGFAAAFLAGNNLVCFFATLQDARIFIQENLDESSAMHGKIEKVSMVLDSESKVKEVSKMVLTMSRGEYLASFKAPKADVRRPSWKSGSFLKKRPKYEKGARWQSCKQDTCHFSHG